MKLLFTMLALVFVLGPPGNPASASPKTLAHVAKLKGCKSLQCDAALALIKSGKEIWPAIRAGLQAQDEMTRFWALGVLSEVPLVAARDSIGALVDDPKIRVRAAAAYALGAIKDHSVSPYLLKALVDKDLNVRFAAAVAMARVKDPKTAPALTRATRDRDEEVRAYACLALGDIGLPQSTSTLMERLDQDAHPKVRGFAAMSLSKFSKHPGRDLLLSRLKEETDAKALAAAIFALGELGDKAALGPLRQMKKTLAAHAVKGIRQSRDVADYLDDAIDKLAARALANLRIALVLPPGWTAVETSDTVTLRHSDKVGGHIAWSATKAVGKSSAASGESALTLGQFKGVREVSGGGMERWVKYRMTTPRGVLVLRFRLGQGQPSNAFDRTVRSLQLR